MMKFFTIVCLLSLISISSCHDTLDSHGLPRPLILQTIETHLAEADQEVKFQCTSWRFMVEANNLAPWKMVPRECVEYVKDYMMGRGYRLDLERVSKEAADFAKSVQLGDDGKDAWIFDIDETLLSNLPYYQEHAFGLEIFDPVMFAKWIEKASAPALEPCLKLYEEILGLGFKVFLLTGRSDDHLNITIDNLKNAGFRHWDKLILRSADNHGKLATIYKSEKRSEMIEEGYRIHGNSGDQWSDLLGFLVSSRSFKLPNPMYYIP